MIGMMDRNREIQLISVVSGVAIVLNTLLLLIKPTVHFGVGDLWKLAASGVTSATVFYFLLKHWLWKIPFLQGWVIEFPNLTGTWKATACSEAFGGSQFAKVSINHKYEDLTYTYRTEHIMNNAIATTLVRSDNNQTILIVVYRNELMGMPANHSAPHDGCCRLVLRRPVKQKRATTEWSLEGEYWTNKDRRTKVDHADRGTVGTLQLEWLQFTIQGFFQLIRNRPVRDDVEDNRNTGVF